MNIENKEQWMEAFVKACENGSLEEIMVLCKRKYLELGWADIHGDNDYGFRRACRRGRLEVVKYLLTSQELIEEGHTFADLHTWNDAGFNGACINGHLEVVKYLLTSPELIEAGHSWAEVHGNNEGGFRWACENEDWEIIRWLVIDYGIKKTPEIEKILEDYSQAQDYFRALEELKEMQALIKETPTFHQEKECKEDERSAKRAKKL